MTVDDRENWVWVEDTGRTLIWRLLPEGTGKRCRWGAGPRRPACGRPAVAEMNRGRMKGWSRVDSWWAYCAEHMYGRRIENGKILILVHPDSQAAERRI